MKFLQLLLISVFLVSSSVLTAQNDTESDSHLLTINVEVFALLNIKSETTKAISLNAKASSEAGAKIELDQKNSDLWINYSSVVEENTSRNVTVQITDGEVPKGIDLTVIAKKYEGDGEGSFGEPINNPILLNNKKTSNIIKDIGNAYTGNGSKKGHNLSYQITQNKNKKNSYSKLKSDNTTQLTITYTLTDN